MTSKIRGFSKETFTSLRYRNFRLFFIGQGISQVGNWLTLVTQTLLVLTLTNSGVAVGLLTACQFAPILLFGAFAGLIADRSDKRKLLITVQFFAMAQSFVLAALALMGDPPVLAIYAVAAMGGLAMAFDNPARRAFVVEMVPQADVNNAVSLNSAVMTSSRVIGPALAGLLIATAGYSWAFALDGLSYIAVIVALWMMNPAELRPAPVAERGKRMVRAGLAYVRRVPDLWIPLVMMAIVGTLAFNFQVVLPLLVKRTFHGDDTTFTLLFSIISIGSLIGALLDRAAQSHHHSPHHRGEHHVRARDARALDHAQPRVDLPHRHGGGLREHLLPDRVDGDRPGPGRAGDARTRARAAGHRLPRQHPDRRPHRRLRQPGVGAARGHRPRCLRLPVRRRVRHRRRSPRAPRCDARPGRRRRQEQHVAGRLTRPGAAHREKCARGDLNPHTLAGTGT